MRCPPKPWWGGNFRPLKPVEASGVSPQSILTYIIIASIIFPAPSVLASKPGTTSLAIAVVPVSDSDSDADSKDVAQAIGSSLGLVSPYHIVDSKLTARVVEYYEKAAAISPPTNTTEADDALARAKEYYFGFRYDDAERELSRAIGLLEARRTEMGIVGPKLVDAYISRAVIAKSKNDMKAVHQSLAQALRINPKLDLTALEYPPSLIAIFDEEKKALNSGAQGSISIVAEPKAADVYLNGVLHGVTPLDISELPAGSYAVKIAANKYNPMERTVQVTAGGTTKIREKLKWTTAKTSRGQKGPTQGEAAAEVGEGLRIADLINADKVVLIDVDGAGGAEKISARMVDRNFRASHRPLVLKMKMGEERSSGLAELAQGLADEAMTDLASDPARRIDPKGIGDPVLLGKRKRQFVGSPLFWGLIGGLAAGALGGGLAAAFTGGGGSSPTAGNVRVEFK